MDKNKVDWVYCWLMLMFLVLITIPCLIGWLLTGKKWNM